MMRICCVLVLVFMTIGCANKHPGESRRAQRYEDISASSLVFTPPIAMGEEPLELARDDRTPRAFVGYDEVSTSYFQIWTEDRQRNAGPDGKVGGPPIERVGVGYRRRELLVGVWPHLMPVPLPPPASAGGC